MSACAYIEENVPEEFLQKEENVPEEFLQKEENVPEEFLQREENVSKGNLFLRGISK